MRILAVSKMNLLLYSIVFSVALVCRIANASNEVATLNGEVYLEEVGYLPGVRVTALSEHGALLHNVFTDDQGQFSMTFSDNSTVLLKLYDPNGRIENSLETIEPQVGETLNTTYRFVDNNAKPETGAAAEENADEETEPHSNKQASDHLLTVSGTVYSYTNRLAGIDVSLSSGLSDGVVTTRTDGNGNYSLPIAVLPSDGEQANLEFEAVDPEGKYKAVKFGAILYPDKSDGYDFHMDPQ